MSLQVSERCRMLGLQVRLSARGVHRTHLVPEAARDLVVAVDAGDHQHLLEQLRRLRQRVPVPRLAPALCGNICQQQT